MKQTSSFSFRRIQPVYLRIIALLVLGWPCFSHWPLSLIAQHDSFGDLLIRLLYTLALGTLISHSTGTKKFLEWLSTAAIIACFVIGPQLAYFQIRTEIGFPPKSGGVEIAKATWTMSLVQQGVTMLTVIPFGIFAVNCFSVAGALERAKSLGNSRRHIVRHSCMVLRVLQHAVETFPPLLQVWREEYPRMLAPRYLTDVPPGRKRLFEASAWLISGARLWTVASLVFALQPVPMFCHELESLFPDVDEPS